ncbi:MAG: N-acetylmuramoyl-L-alanine amidase [Deltaproteobacteria bacterium]|nr:N-acetylmuramoyl-L-alanine amidase [Deltaproteobacteria bacterium]
MMKGYKPILFKLHIVIISFLFIMLAHPAITKAKFNKHHNPIQKKTIVIDPGHGGFDKGARGPDGTFEKTVTMELARVLAAELEKTYKVILTRTDDYRVDILTRTATANHLNAEMFISIHTGGSFLHQASGISLYYYEKIKTSAFVLETESMEESKSSSFNELWSNIQGRHQKNNKVLAEGILNSFKDKMGEKVEYNAEIQGAPLMVLEGADMPAILIEIGYITNPTEEKSLNDINVLSDIAQKIKNGIDVFFEKAP